MEIDCTEMKIETSEKEINPFRFQLNQKNESAER